MKLTAETILKGIAVAMGALVVLMAAIELQQALEDETAERPTAASRDAVGATLQRCRTLAPEALETDSECRAAWAEQRRRFFGLPADDQGKE